jgi:hypothetical protein
MILSRDEVLARLADRNLGLVFGCDVQLRDRGRSVDEVERDEESETHRHLRNILVRFCEKHGIGIYPNNVGRRGRYVMADALLCHEESAPLFVEILGSPQAMTAENVRRKRALGSPEAPLRFLMTGFDYECFIGDGDGPGWGSDVVLEDKDDILRTGRFESPITTRGTLRKVLRWQHTPTVGKYLREHFGLPPAAQLRPLKLTANRRYR